ncbi:hypothetical protein [Pantoea sp. EEL5]|uniref:hypothetical protein n=1 Tax=Pantoea sp. EEL5 TaxID=3416806 RepID=UPI003CE96C4F
MCDDCRCEENYFEALVCVAAYLQPWNPRMWLRCVFGDDDSIAHSISRSVTSSDGYVLAIWNGTGRGWRLRKDAADGNDFPVDSADKRFTELTEELLFQLDTLYF